MASSSVVSTYFRRRQCIVNGCCSRMGLEAREIGIRFYYVPDQPKIRADYAILSGHDGPFPEKAVVCSLHFLETDFNEEGQLNLHVRPSVNLPPPALDPDPIYSIPRITPLPARKRGLLCVVAGCSNNLTFNDPRTHFLPCRFLPVGNPPQTIPSDAAAYYAWNELCGKPDWTQFPTDFIVCPHHFHGNSSELRHRGCRLRRDPYPTRNLPTQAPGLSFTPDDAKKSCEDLLSQEIARKNSVEFARNIVSEFITPPAPVAPATTSSPIIKVTENTITAVKVRRKYAKRSVSKKIVTDDRKTSELLLLQEMQKRIKQKEFPHEVPIHATTVSMVKETAALRNERLKKQKWKVAPEDRLQREILRKQLRGVSCASAEVFPSASACPFVQFPQETQPEPSDSDVQMQQAGENPSPESPSVSELDLNEQVNDQDQQYIQTDDSDLSMLLQTLAGSGQWIAPKGVSDSANGNVLLVWQPTATGDCEGEMLPTFIPVMEHGIPLENITYSELPSVSSQSATDPQRMSFIAMPQSGQHSGQS